MSSGLVFVHLLHIETRLLENLFPWIEQKIKNQQPYSKAAGSREKIFYVTLRNSEIVHLDIDFFLIEDIAKTKTHTPARIEVADV